MFYYNADSNKSMQKIILLLCFFICLGITAQNKTVYMSVDVSASMKGDKYNLANYTAQMITALMDEQDELYFSICSDFQKINMQNSNRQQSIQALQKPFRSLKVVYIKTEIGDINTFINIFRNKPDRDQYYFIVGDGYWHTEVENASENFKRLVTNNPVKVYFLETMKSMSEHGDFGQRLDNLPFVSQYRSSNDPQTIINNCILLATSIFGISHESVALKKESDKCYSFQSQLPIKKLYALYQEETSGKDLPLLTNVTCNSANIPIIRQSTVSTEKLIYDETTEKLLSGQIIVLDANALLPAGKDIKLYFNKEINPSNLNIFPMVDVKLTQPEFEAGLGTPRIDGNDVIICLENNKIKLKYTQIDDEGNILPASILQKIKTVIKTTKGEYTPKLVDGFFECEIPLSDEELEYTINSQCPGYFNIVSDKRKIIRSKDCDRPIQGEMQSKGDIHINDLMAGKGNIFISIVDKDNPSIILNPKEHIIKISNNNKHLFDEVTIGEITDTDFEIKFTVRNSLCECFIPNQVEVEVYTEDKSGKYEANSKIFIVDIDKSNTSKIEQCKWMLITIVLLLILIIYMNALKKKKRFKKGAMIRYQYFGVGGIKSRENVDDLRAKGLLSWINRWLIPMGAERTSKSFPKAGNKVFTFTANSSVQRIEIPKTQYDPKQMSSIDYDRDQFERKDVKSFSMSDNTLLKITLPGGTGSFQIRYDKGTGISNDVPAFRIFTSLIIAVATIGIAILGYLFISSLF